MSFPRRIGSLLPEAHGVDYEAEAFAKTIKKKHTAKEVSIKSLICSSGSLPDIHQISNFYHLNYNS